MPSKPPSDVVHRQEALETYLDQMFEREGLTFETWAAMFGQGFYQNRNELILDLIRPLAPVRVFEFACAGGFLAQLLLSELPTIEAYTCSNFSPRMIEYTRRQLAEHRKCEVKLIDADVTRSDDMTRAALSPYDVFITTSFEHIQFDRELIARLPPATHFVFSVTGFDDPEHFRVFSSEEEVRTRYSDVLHIRHLTHNQEANKFVVLARTHDREGISNGLSARWRGLVGGLRTRLGFDR
jgi:hypothetical protein